MVGILSYGAYIPIYRLSRTELARMWGGSPRGERSVANCDEDSITMAVEAAVDCLNGIDRASVDGLYFASTSSPYRLKQSASIIAAAADLRRDVFTADFANSTGGGASALRSAIDAIKAGSARKVLVVAADCQLTPPNSTFESNFGDGAAALLVGDGDTVANHDGQYSISSDFLDVWKRDRGDVYLRTWEDRFVVDYGYTAHLKEAITGLMKAKGLEVADIARFAFYGPDPRSHAGMARVLRLGKDQIQDAMFDVLGNTGAAFFMMLLVAALEKAKTGERIIAGSYGDGADAFLFNVNEGIDKMRDRRGVSRHLASKMMLAGYGTYLKFRNLMEWEKTPMPEPESSLTVMWRDEKALTRGYGQTCKACGHVQFPPQRVCMWCQARGQLEDIRLSDRKGKLFSFSLDERAVFALDLPNVIAIVDLDGGGRVYSQLTDRDPAKVQIEMPIEMTFRKFHEGAGFHNYAWKCRPVRC
jgi:3-hydroxy-3-methylglutaryl CoA synthase